MSDPLLAAKLALERELERPLSHVLMAYVIAKQDGMTLFGRTAYASQLQHVLIEHYARVVMVMTGRRPSRPQIIEGAALSAEHAVALKRRASHQAQLILTSIDREWDRTEETKASPETSGLLSSMGSKAKAVWQKIKNKLGSMISSQTNSPAEEARAQAAQTAAGNRPLMKVWSTMLDERVRETHRAAEGQERSVSQAFDVGQSKLMFPGDNSLGASLSELVNCRCAAKFYAMNADGTREDLGSTPRLTPVRPNRSVGSVNHPALITKEVTLREGIQRIFLPDMLEARITIRNGVLTVTRGGQSLARGTYTHGVFSGARIRNLVIGPKGQGLGIPELIERSVAHTNGR